MGLLHSKTDQKGQNTVYIVYTYDSTYRRLQKIDKYPGATWNPADACQEVNFHWDNSPWSNFSAGAARRVAAVQYRGKNCSAVGGNSYKEEFAYTNYGSPSGKQLTVTKKLAGGTDASASMQALWTYDSEGRPRNVQYPLTGTTYQYSQEIQDLGTDTGMWWAIQ